MAKEIHDAKVVILTCPFEPPKPKTKHGLEIKTAEDYEKLQKMEQDYFTDMVKRVKDSGANVVLCQWGFDESKPFAYASQTASSQMGRRC